MKQIWSQILALSLTASLATPRPSSATPVKLQRFDPGTISRRWDQITEKMTADQAIALIEIAHPGENLKTLEAAVDRHQLHATFVGAPDGGFDLSRIDFGVITRSKDRWTYRNADSVTRNYHALLKFVASKRVARFSFVPRAAADIKDLGGNSP